MTIRVARSTSGSGCCFFFQAEDGIRDYKVTGVQTCALPILLLAGIVVGLILGYLVSLSSGSVWQASALLYLGNPLSVGGGSPVSSLGQNPKTVKIGRASCRERV